MHYPLSLSFYAIQLDVFFRVNWICAIITLLYLNRAITSRELCQCHYNSPAVGNTPLCTSNTMLGPVAGVPIRPAPSVFSYGQKCPCYSHLSPLTDMWPPHVIPFLLLSSFAPATSGGPLWAPARTIGPSHVGPPPRPLDGALKLHGKPAL